MNLPKTSLALALAALMAGEAAAKTLSLGEYLGQVGVHNATLQSLRSQNRGYDLAAKEPLTAYSPALTADYSHDETQSSLKPGSGLTACDAYNTSWDLGVSKLFFTGTTLAVGYKSGWGETLTTAQPADGDPLDAFSAAQKAQLAGLMATGYTGRWYTAAPTLSVSQSLWKGFMARGAELAVDKAAHAYAGLRESNLDQAQQVCFGAESAYVQLALAQATFKVRQATLDRAKNTLAWTQNRARRNLAERSDVVASLAAVKQAEVNLASAEQGLETAGRAFNALRQAKGAAVDEELQPLAAPGEDAVRRGEDRHDLRAAEHQAAADRLAAAAAAEQYRPDVSLFYNCALNGAGAEYGDALRNPDRLAWAAGVKVKANIDVGLILDVVKGAKEASAGSEASLAQKRADLDRDWEDLKTQWRSVRRRLADAEELVALQREKMELERQLFEDGRTTHAQVLTYENDFNNAQLARLGLIAEACTVAAKAKYYNGAY